MATESIFKQRLPQEKYRELEEFIDTLPEKRGELIRVLHKAQQIFGYLPEEVQIFVGKKLGVPTSKVFGVVTFYSYFTMNPRGDVEISVCMGTACYVKGAEKILKEFENELGIKNGEVTQDGKFKLNALRCIGACGLAPIVMVGDKIHSKVKPEMVKEIVGELKKDNG